MKLSQYLPFYNRLTEAERQQIAEAAVQRTVPKGTLLHSGLSDCLGLLVICSGQLRAFLTSDEGREITVYRLFERDICLFSASCMMRSIQFDITISAEKDTELWIIPPYVYKALMEQSLAVSNYTNELMATRFTEVMWLIEQIMWRSVDKRLADFLLQERVLEGSQTLKITHEKIAGHLGTAREVVTRMLRYFQSEGMVALTRGTITILDVQKLQQLSET